jgi:hypothetical protein
MSTARFPRSAVPVRLRSRVVSAALVVLVPAAMLVAGVTLGATAVRADPPPTDPPPAGYDPATSVAVSRTANETDYQNADGTMSAQLSGGPLNYQASDGAWHAIDNSVQPDPAQPGGYRNVANDWRVHFGATTQGVVVDTDDGSLGMTPIGASNLAPATTSTSSVTYPDAWPNVDLTYKVTPEGVKESVLLKNRSAATHFSFAIRSGTAAEVLAERGADDTALTRQSDGSVTPAGNLGDAVTLGAPTVLRADGAPVDGAGATLTATTGHTTLALDPTWLAAQPDSAFPINLDPDVQTGYTTIESFKNDGTTCSGSGCVGVQFGNSNEPVGARYWRTVAHFPYSSLFGDKVLDAKLGFAFEGGSHNAYPVHVHWASSYSYDGAAGHPEIVLSASPGDTATSFYGSSALTDQVASWVDSGSLSGAFGFIGAEQPGVYTYQVYNVALWVLYDRPPEAPADLTFQTPSKSCAGRQIIDGTKTFVLQAKVEDPDPLPDTNKLIFEIWNSQHTQMILAPMTTRTAAGRYNLLTASLKPFALPPSYAFDWRVQGKDSHGLLGPHSDFCPGYTYYPPPNVPSGLAMTSPKSASCATGAPTAVNTLRGLSFKATVSDPDRKSVYAQVQIVKTNDSSTVYYTGNTAWVTPAGGGTSVTLAISADDLAHRPSGQTPMPDGAAFSWRVRTVQSAKPFLASDWVPVSPDWCHGEVDDTLPGAPNVTGSSSPLHLGDPTQTMTFSGKDAVAFTYSLTGWNLPTAQPACGSGTDIHTICASAGSGWNTVPIPAPTTDHVDVWVEAFDAAGNVSATTQDVTLPVKIGKITHAWVTDTQVIDEDGSDPGTLPDWDGAASSVPLTVSDPDGGWVSDGLYAGPALHFDGTNQAASSDASTPVDISHGFSVATWLRPGTGTGAQVAVAQNGPSGSATWIGLDAGGHVQFCLESAETADGSFNGDCATAPAGLAAGQWSQVAASWNGFSHKLLLYVNGSLVASASHTSTPALTGAFVIGHGSLHGAAASYWQGDVADTATYDDALADSQISDLATCGLLLVDPNGPCAAAVN